MRWLINKKIFLIFSMIPNLICAQNLKLIIPEEIKQEIESFEVSPAMNTLIINNNYFINLRNLNFNIFNSPFNLSVFKNYFINENEILTFSGSHGAYIRSIENQVLKTHCSDDDKFEEVMTLYPLKDSSYITIGSTTTNIFNYTSDCIKKEYQYSHVTIGDPRQTNLDYGPPIIKNKMIQCTIDNCFVYDVKSKKQIASYPLEKDHFNSIIDKNNLSQIYCDFNNLRNNTMDGLNCFIVKNLKTGINDSIYIPVNHYAVWDQMIIDTNLVIVFSLTLIKDSKTNKNGPFGYVIDLKSKKIIKTLFTNINYEHISGISQFINKPKNIYFLLDQRKIIVLSTINYQFREVILSQDCHEVNINGNTIKRIDFQTLSNYNQNISLWENSIFISRDENILFVNHENFISCYELGLGKEILQIFLISDEITEDDDEQSRSILYKLPNSNYFSASKSLMKKLHYTELDLNIIGFEQLDPIYNRPDIVLDSIGKYFGNSDGGMIDEYRKSWEKRIDRLGLDKEKLGKGEIAVPNAEIVGADAIAYENKNGILDIKVAANDPKYPLRRFNVYVNEVPLYGSAGISIAHLKKQVWDTTVSVTLSIGENKIQVSVMNELGLENFKYPCYVNYTPLQAIVAKTYYIGIGVNEFKESSHNLKYCVKDVTDLSTSFGEPNTEIKLFTNSQVTKENILALKDYLSKTTVNDKVIISCSSHGLLDDSLNFYLAMHDVDFNNPKERGLKYEELENLLDGIPARQKLLLLDACNSGENDKTEVFKNELANNHNNMDSTQILAARGVIIKLKDENKSNFKKMNELFVNVRNNTGSVIISAAGGQESALEAITLEGKSIENGAFSYCVLEYLQNNSNNPEELTVNKLKNYVEKRVEEITNGKQQPTSRQETMEVDWRLR